MRESTTRDFELAKEYGSGRILLRNLDDPAKYLSAEFAGIAVDELTRNERSVFDFLRSRLRWPGVSRPGFVAGTNPSGIGHAWVKKYWITREFPSELTRLKDEFFFVPAKSSDNPYLSEQYHSDLETLPPDMAKAYAEGSWDVFAGQYFDIWNPDTMVSRPESFNVKPWWPRWIGIDWGFEHNAATYWFARDKDKVFTTNELVCKHVAPRELAREICKASEGQQIVAIFLSPDAFAHRTDENSIAEQMGEVFREHGLPYPSPADDDRVGGWMLCYQMLASGLSVIGSNCTHLIQCLPTLVRDSPKKPEDIAKMEGDDPADAWRYGLKTMLDAKGTPWNVQVAETLREIDDPTFKHIRAQQLIAQKQSADRSEGGSGGRLKWMRGR